MFNYISTSAEATIKSVKTAADQINLFAKRSSIGALDAAMKEGKEDIDPNISTDKNDVNVRPEDQHTLPATATEPSSAKSNTHEVSIEKIQEPKESPVNNFMLVFQAKLDSNDFVSAFELILDPNEKNKTKLLKNFITALKKQNISIEEFIIDHYPDRFNKEMLDILLTRAKQLPKKYSTDQEKNHFDRYWRFVLDYLIQQRDWIRLNDFLDVLPPHAEYYKFLLTKVTDINCQETLLKRLDKQELVSYAIALDTLDLILLLMNQQVITYESLPTIAQQAFDNTPKAWKILAYCAKNLTEDNKKQAEVIQFWTKEVLEAAINTQRWSFAKTIISLFPFQEHYKGFYLNVDAECQREIQKLDINFQKKFIEQAFSEDDLYPVAKTLIDKHFLKSEHKPLVANWVKRKFNDASVTASDKANPAFTALVEAIAANETLMSDRDINATLCEKALNIALSGKHEKLADTLLICIFSKYLNDSSNIDLLQLIKTALEKIIFYKNEKQDANYIKRVRAFCKYIQTLLNTATPELKQGPSFFASADARNNNAMGIYTLFVQLQSSKNSNLNASQQSLKLLEFDRQLYKETDALKKTTAEKTSPESQKKWGWRLKG